jgi:hypothetical protein
MTKFLNKLGTEGMYFNTLKTMHEKPTADIIFNGEKLNALHLRLGINQGC